MNAQLIGGQYFVMINSALMCWSLRCRRFLILSLLGLSIGVAGVAGMAEEKRSLPTSPDPATIKHKVMCGYQGWFRCPGDQANAGWIHWSRDSKRIARDTLTFEMWPDMTEYGEAERYRATGFTYPDGSPAELFSSDNGRTVQRHFEWMRDYGIDGAWLQHFVVDLPSGPAEDRYPSRKRVLGHVRTAAKNTGRVWCLAFDVAGMPDEKIFPVLTSEWKKLVEEGITHDEHYLHEGGKPVVKIWGFYRNSEGNKLSYATSRKLIEFFKSPGPYQCYLVGGGDWDWRRGSDPRWRELYYSFDCYMPWNVGNHWKDAGGVKHAATAEWAADQQALQEHGVAWVPVVYPGFRWDNLQRKTSGSSEIPRRGGEFLWEQIHAAAELKIDTLYVAMFDEVDEGTAVFKVTNTPPAQASFLDYEGKPSDWYLRLLGHGGQMLRGEVPRSKQIPIQP